ncbi:MAG: hypothetical protein U0Z70_14105 [Thermomicrobiales bacterium]
MDSLLLTRMSMAGWLLAATILWSIWGSSSPYWNRLETLISDLMAPDASTAAIAVLGVVVGLTGPPAIGFLIERTVSVCATYGARLLRFIRRIPRGSRVFGTDPTSFLLYAEDAIADPGNPYLDLDDRSFFRLFFLNKENEAVIKYRDMRRTQFFTSSTSLVAILIGLWIASTQVDVWTSGRTYVILLIVVVLLIHASLNYRWMRNLEVAWMQVYGWSAVANSPIGIQSKTGACRFPESGMPRIQSIGARAKVRIDNRMTRVLRLDS